jgi:hypothetical protein
MVSLTANEAMLAILSGTKELAEIRDGNGTVIGFFAPIALPKAQMYAEAAAHIDPAEIQRRKEDKQKGRTTEEVLERLKALEKP